MYDRVFETEHALEVSYASNQFLICQSCPSSVLQLGRGGRAGTVHSRKLDPHRRSCLLHVVGYQFDRVALLLLPRVAFYPQ